MPDRIHPVSVSELDPSPYQARQRFAPGELEELAASIREHGILQPLLVRRTGERYQLIAGERRLRAARLAGLERVPALVRELTDAEAFEASLIENLQREDLSVVEEARAYRRLAEEFGYNHAEIARRTGRSRAAVSNTVRLLQLPERVLELLDEEALTEGHARALLGLPEPLRAEAADWAVRNGVTVRELERRARALRPAPAGDSGRAPNPGQDAAAYLLSLEERLRARFGTRAVIAYRRGRGAVTLEFYSDDDLYRVLELLGIEA